MNIIEFVARVVRKLGFQSRLKWLPDKTYLQLVYRDQMGVKLDLRNPKTFNEKLQWLKLYDRNPEYINMVDKYEAKKYVAERIGDEYIIPTLGVWERFDDIDFDTLPNEFVLKCTHDSGGVIVCRDKNKFDKEDARKKIEKALKRNFYWGGREWPYKNVKPRIIAEEYMTDNCEENKDDFKPGLTDYKMLCFNGKHKCSFVCSERNSKNGLKVTFYNKEWEKMPFKRHYPSSNTLCEKPKTYDEMVELAEKLAEKLPFVRVDFYEINGRVRFGELTLYPGSGFEEFSPEVWDDTLGSWIELPGGVY